MTTLTGLPAIGASGERLVDLIDVSDGHASRLRGLLEHLAQFREPPSPFEGYLSVHDLDRVVTRVQASLDPMWEQEDCHGAVLVVAPAAVNTNDRTLARLAFTDPLTGLGNRLLLTDRLGQAMARMKRGGESVAVLFIDLDGFKAVNDRFGHAHGDRVLARAAAALQQSLRQEDTLVRYGGDEFVAICELASGGWVEITERLQNPLRQAGETLDTPIALTAAIGVAVATHPHADPMVLVHQADLNMYRHKTATRIQERVS